MLVIEIWLLVPQTSIVVKYEVIILADFTSITPGGITVYQNISSHLQLSHMVKQSIRAVKVAILLPGGAMVWHHFALHFQWGILIGVFLVDSLRNPGRGFPCRKAK